jgi:hypothetical protein
MQWTETGIYLAVALMLAGFCYWRLGRRLSLRSAECQGRLVEWPCD